ncbi:T9SS type A sorting domain-containing protein [Ulvibacter antarcticus]|uniref:Putative secreted protein (Por secretion system target) n=1 Tax=Ulvibacter antarcticus TaxID=442714 RepID=A0A3L9YYF4_9FLAO|nr:T9SS type A sorting domain-containing protein [Ulvibacter antarcticus]RMA64870.1 putative secreted protein (Por secretion system target) [Ulvibacter antarcticus]
MKKITFLLLFIAFSVNAQVGNYNVGDVVDDFTVTDVEGVEHNLYTYISQGKYVWLDFFFDTCYPCQQTTPIFNEFFDKYGCNLGDVVCLSINNGSDDDAAVIAFGETYGGTFNHAPAVSSEGGSAAVDINLGIFAYPTYCMIGPGNVLLEKDIWVNGTVTLEDFENTFPSGFEPPVTSCSLGFEDNDIVELFQVFPAISNGVFSIILNDQSPVSLRIYDVSGKIVFQNDYNEKEISMQLNLNAGTYFVNVVSENSIGTKTIIIQ